MTNEELAMLLYGAGAIELQDVAGGKPGFSLKAHQDHPDAPRSPIFVNLRGAPKGKLRPEILQVIGYRIAETALERGYSPDLAVVGLPKAGEPLAEAFVAKVEILRGERPTLLTLEKKEEEGKREILPVVHGDWEPGQEIVMIDDLVTKADTKREGARALRANGLEVKHCYILLDRSEDATAELATDGISLHSVFTLEELLDWYWTERLITEETFRQVLAYPKLLSDYIAAQSR